MSAQPPRTHARVVAEMLSLRAQPRRWRRLPRVVDLFAGAGGASWGATLAGCNVVAAVNHDATMLEAHSRAVPWAAHLCEDIERLSPLALPAHEVLWASPECTGHSRARGKDRQHHDASRATAFCPVRVADYHRPRAVIIENVIELRAWSMFEGWLTLWRNLGYREDTAAPSADAQGFCASDHGITLNSADFGVPQARERVFFVFTDARRIRRGPDLSTPPQRPHVPVRSVVDWDTSRGFWSDWHALCDDTRARITAEIARSGTPCMVAYHGSEKAGRSLDKPCGVLDRNDRYRVVVGDLGRHLRVSEMLAIGGFPADYPVPSTHKKATEAVGASVVPAVAEWLFNKVMEVIR